MSGASCIWCETKFAARKNGGSAQRFCSKDCRQDFHIACRTWAVREYEAGRVSLTALRSPPGQRARCIERDSDPKGPLVAKPVFDKDAPSEVEFLSYERDLIARAAGSAVEIASARPENAGTAATHPSDGPRAPARAR